MATMPSAVKDYMTSPAEFVAWMFKHGWTVDGLAAAGVAGGRRNIYRMREGKVPIPKVLVLALPAINRAHPREERGS